MGHPFHPCPKCNRQLAAVGVVSVSGGPEMPVYQCDECLVTGNVFGESAELALTFCVEPGGRMFNPNSPDEPFTPPG